jgi:twitching motility two-component system response regulator PilH
LARKILLADDSVTAQNMGRKILTDAGYEVVTVNNGSAALKKIAEHHPDLIVLDVYMPGYSGLEVCQRLKENRETNRIPILLTVGKLEPFKPDEARRVRADAYVIKPFEASELLTALTKLEDKIVPQASSDSNKPGRFAQAIANFEESNTDTGEKFGDSESGWKNRIRIPGKKKKDEQEIEAAPESKSAPQVEGLPITAPASKVAPEMEVTPGLPSDITPEEIAAITAAAAQLSGSAAPVAETKPAERSTAITAELGQPAEPALEAKAVSGEITAENATQATAASAEAEAPDQESSPVTFASATVAAEATSAPSEVGKDALAVADSTPAETVEPAATEIAQSNNAEVSEEKKPAPEPDSDVIAALQALTPVSETLVEEKSPVEAVAEMALTAAGQQQGPRWIAETMPVDAGEANTPLEAEMQKAFAAYAAADVGRVSLPAAAIAGSYVVPAPSVEEPTAIAEPQQPTPTLETAIAAVAASGSSSVSSVAEGDGAMKVAESTSGGTPSQSEVAKAEYSSSESHADPLRAAAWANWSQIRDSIIGATASAEQVTEPKTNTPPSAEQTPKPEPPGSVTNQVAPTESPTASAEAGAIASIVESVLAELRPKIVEEITKKLGADKK